MQTCILLIINKAQNNGAYNAFHFALGITLGLVKNGKLLFNLKDF